MSFILFKLIGLHEFANQEWSWILFDGLHMIPIFFFTYGLPFLAGFCVAMITLDSLGFNLIAKQINLILCLEWLIIVPPFFYWAFKYEYWLWLSLILSFAVTQWIRKGMIEKINRKALLS
ncbi:MAG: hypothetical protein EP332_03475 [Bacteroidetes bacterium]|nr:MAG: hypothetical protein EP332_03475 [Bacteroidota bacterium]